jgi:DNA-3-methyladenine glycosylase I
MPTNRARTRCTWAGQGDTALGRYHDEVWGTRTYEPQALFEALTLGVFEVGLSWAIVFGKRDAFRSAFHGFDPAKVARMTDTDVARLVGDASIIRNRAKIIATTANAQTMLAASPSLAELARSYAQKRDAPPREEEIPASTEASAALATELKAQGYKFIGPTSAYAFMQNVGIVNDHALGCFRAVRAGKPATQRREHK